MKKNTTTKITSHGVKKDIFFKKMESLGLAITYDDVRLKSGYSGIDLKDISLESRFSRNIPLHIPIVSAAMDTVTEAKMAIALAKAGGLGIVHKALTIEEQTSQVTKVKLHLNGLIEKPICVKDSDTIGEVLAFRERKEYGFHSFPVMNAQGKFVGILTHNDCELAPDTATLVKNAMTPVREAITAPRGTSLKQAYEILRKSRKKILPLIEKNGELTGMYVFSDVKRLLGDTSTLYNVNPEGHLRVGAAIGTGEHELMRSESLVKAGCDVLVIDTAHGDSKNVYEMLRILKKQYPRVDIVAGNVSEGESAKRLARAGADGIKVGQGPAAICTTRIIAGIGCPQVTAIYNCAKALQGSRVPICADGGLKNSGDIPIALGAGADSVMLGRILAGTTETPGPIRETRAGRVKIYRGMGSLGAMAASRAARERYRQGDVTSDKLVPEGIESIVPYQGDVAQILGKQVGGLRSGMGYVGAKNIAELKVKADFHRISSAGLAESYPHDVTVTDTTQL